MAKKKARVDNAPTPGMEAWLEVTSSDVEKWADTKTFSRGFAYFTKGAVKGLRRVGAHSGMAWVHGTNKYATLVTLDSDDRSVARRLGGECSCPVGWGCKHAVALVLACAQAATKQLSIPEADDNDARWTKLDGDGRFLSPQQKARKARGNRELEEHLRSKSKDELIAMLLAATAQSNTLQEDLRTAMLVSSGRSDDLLKAARAELQSVTSEEVWYNSWRREGHLPDYSKLERLLKSLLDAGRFDDLVVLGRELLELGNEQVESSQDEGETAAAIASCLEVTAEGLKKSTLPAKDKLLTAIDFLLGDDFDLSDSFQAVMKSVKDKAAWSAAADTLLARLKPTLPPKPRGDEGHAGYRRGELSRLAMRALDACGRSEEATEHCVSEAKLSGEYGRGVDRLIVGKRFDEATALALEGLEKTPPRYTGSLNQLEGSLATIACHRKDWRLVAAYTAEEFFRSPSLDHHKALVAASRKAKCEPEVSLAAERFLETGHCPTAGARSAGSAWPLPKPDLAPTSSTSPKTVRPHYAVLVALAIDRKQPAEVIKWYRAYLGGKSGLQSAYEHRADLHCKVAKAIEGAFPEEAIEIHSRLAETYASETNTGSYPPAVKHLASVRRIMSLQYREDFWPDVLAAFREKHKRKRRLMELLDADEKKAARKAPSDPLRKTTKRKR